MLTAEVRQSGKQLIQVDQPTPGKRQQRFEEKKT
jgi:hypothetical protein